MERTQFTFYESFFKAISRIKKKTDRADAYDIICRYALLQEEPDLDNVSDSVAIAFELLRPVLDKAKERAESGKRGGSKPKNSGENSEANPKQNESKTEANSKLPAREKENEKENEKEVEIENDSVYGASTPTHDQEQQENSCQKAKRFSRPTVEEVTEYCRERGNQVDAHRFVDYYTANGWRVGKNPMKDWKAAVRTWEQQESASSAPAAPRWSKPDIPKGASGQLGEAELEAIQRVLREN